MCAKLPCKYVSPLVSRLASTAGVGVQQCVAEVWVGSLVCSMQNPGINFLACCSTGTGMKSERNRQGPAHKCT